MGFFDKPEIIGPGADRGGDRGGDSTRVSALEERVARLEAQVAQLLARPPAQGAAPVFATDEQPWMGEVHRLVAAGRKIQAIKVYRQQTGLGLKEAKDAVDAL